MSRWSWGRRPSGRAGVPGLNLTTVDFGVVLDGTDSAAFYREKLGREGNVVERMYLSARHERPTPEFYAGLQRQADRVGANAYRVLHRDGHTAAASNLLDNLRARTPVIYSEVIERLNPSGRSGLPHVSADPNLVRARQVDATRQATPGRSRA